LQHSHPTIPVSRLARALDAQEALDDPAVRSRLIDLGIAALKVNPDPALIATEGALWGFS
jgi:hypothetical protein